MPVHYAQRLFPLTLWESTALTSGGYIYSAVIPCTNRVPDVLMFRAQAAVGTASVKIEYAISNDGVNFNSYTSQDPITATTGTEFAGAKNPEEYHALNCPSAPYIKLKLTDMAATDTVVDGTLWMREL